VRPAHREQADAVQAVLGEIVGVSPACDGDGGLLTVARRWVPLDRTGASWPRSSGYEHRVCPMRRVPVAADLSPVQRDLLAACLDPRWAVAVSGQVGGKPHHATDLDLAPYGVVKVLEGRSGDTFPDMPSEPKAAFAAAYPTPYQHG